MSWACIAPSVPPYENKQMTIGNLDPRAQQLVILLVGVVVVKLDWQLVIDLVVTYFATVLVLASVIIPMLYYLWVNYNQMQVIQKRLDVVDATMLSFNNAFAGNTEKTTARDLVRAFHIDMLSDYARIKDEKEQQISINEIKFMVNEMSERRKQNLWEFKNRDNVLPEATTSRDDISSDKFYIYQNENKMM